MTYLSPFSKQLIIIHEMIFDFVYYFRVHPSRLSVTLTLLIIFHENSGYHKLRHEILLRIVPYAYVNINDIKMFIAFINFT